MESFIVLGIAALTFIVGEIGYLIYHVYAKRRQQESVIQNLEEGNTTRLSGDELDFIKKAAKKARKHFTIDDITWNDLSMDEVFMQMNYCLSSAGDQNLYGDLRTPLTEPQAIQKKRELLAFLREGEDAKRLRSVFYRIGGQCESAIDALYYLPQNQVHVPVGIAYFMLVVTCLLLLVGCFVPGVFMLGILACGLNYFIASQARKSHAYAYQCAMHLVRYARAMQSIAKCDGAEYLNRQFPIYETAKKLEKLQLSWFDDIVSGDGFFLMMAQNVFLMEIILYHQLSKQLFAQKNAVKEAVAIIGELDTLLAVSTYQEHLPKYCDVSFQVEKDLQAKQMFHPLVENCVANDVDLTQNILISGSNASGKSTYLKMIAINAIFAQSFGFALADAYCGTTFQIMTSMALKDSLEAKDSYFVAEVRSIKRIMEQLEKETPVLCMIDEILRGTNTGERIGAASEILMCLVQHGARCIAATHDLELTRILSNHYRNIHFIENFDQEAMKFDYQLQNGPSNSRNAIKLLESFGFDQDTIQLAKKQRDYFETHGIWMYPEGSVKERA